MSLHFFFFQLDENRIVETTVCNCVYNRSQKCKHVAAVLHYINCFDSFSKTDEEQQWGKPTTKQFAKEKYCKGKYFDEIFVNNKKYPEVPFMPVQNNELQQPSFLLRILKVFYKSTEEKEKKKSHTLAVKEAQKNEITNDCEACMSNLHVFCDDHVIYSSFLEVEKELLMYFKNNVVMEENNLVKLCCNTLSQSESQEWFDAKKVRISASKSTHRIKTLKTKTNNSLVLDILYP